MSSWKYLCDHVGQTFWALPKPTVDRVLPRMIKPAKGPVAAYVDPPISDDCVVHNETAEHEAAEAVLASERLAEGIAEVSHLRSQLENLNMQCEALSQQLQSTLQRTYQQDADLARCMHLLNQITQPIADFEQSLAGLWVFQNPL